MSGYQGPSGRKPPENIDLLPALIDDAFISGLSNLSPRVYPSSHPPIANADADADASSSWGPPGHWPEDPSFENQISFSPAFASSSSSSSSPSPLGHWPPQDPSRRPHIAAAPTEVIVNQCEDVLSLDSLRKGSRIPIIISRQFPLKDLLWLSTRIANEMMQPLELRVFEVANPDILDELPKKLFLLSKREKFLVQYEYKCRLAITNLRETASMIMTLERISADGIELQIHLLKTAMNEISRELEVVRQTLGR